MTSAAPPIDRVIDGDDGVRLRLLEWRPHDDVGPERRWLCVHGLASNAWLWSGVADHLRERGHHVVAVDQRGHGRSSRPDPPDRAAYTTPVAADELTTVLDRLGWHAARLVGQSWGGNVVVEAGRRHPERVLGVTAVDGGTIELADRFPRWEDCEAALRPPPLAGRPLTEIEHWLAESAGDWPEAGRVATLENFERFADGTIAPHLVLEDHLAVLHGLWSHDPWPAIDRAPVPMQFLMASSGDDDIGRTRLERRLAEATLRAGSSRRVRWFLDGHHDLHAQQPQAIGQALLAST